MLMHNAPGGRVAGLRPAHHGRATASLTFRAGPLPAGSWPAGPLSAGPLPGASLPGGVLSGGTDRRAVLAERMAGVGWRVPSLLAALPQADDFYFDAISTVKVETWSRGRVALLGDAGYRGSPLSGQGTSLALVGAYVLAGELAAAFAVDQRELSASVAAGTELPPGGISAFAPRSAALIALRAHSMRLMTRWPLRPLMARQFQKADRTTLKDYPTTRS